MSIIALVSTSGGKDSTATLLLAIERVPRKDIYPAFADTGNEHDEVYRYLDYLESALSLSIKRLKADFTEDWWRKRDYVDRVWREEGVSPEIVASALEVLNAGPTGNPYLDLCVVKGRFPSRMAQFCTQRLKKEPLSAYAVELMANGPIESWQGVRRDESANRAKLAEREDTPEGISIYRPILDWTWRDVFAKHREHGIKPNPLYAMGMTRVGCMPCINCKKDELLSIARRFPAQVDRIRKWEQIVSAASKRGSATFFFDEESGVDGRGIHKTVEWAQTERGGKQFDIFRALHGEVDECESAYGLCEVAPSPDDAGRVR